jgi:signal transduction histidine kinase
MQGLPLSSSTRRRAACLGLLLVLSISELGAQPIRELRRLTPEQAAEARPVQVQGVITWRNQGAAFWGCIVDDGDEGIYVSIRGAEKAGVLPTGESLREQARVGARVEIEGVTGPGEYAPLILPRTMRPLDDGTPQALPPAKQTTMTALLSGALDCQRVTVQGVVASAQMDTANDWLELLVRAPHGPLRFRLIQPGAVQGAPLVNCMVRLRGCVLADFNARRELVGVTLSSNLSEDIEVVRAGERDPFAAPMLPLSGLRQFSAEGVVLHRRRVRGVVTAHRQGEVVFLQEEGRGVRVYSDSVEPLKPGDVIEAAGFVNYQAQVACLEHAVYRKTGSAPAPAPEPVTVTRILKSGGDGVRRVGVEDLDGRLVSLEGRVLSSERRPDEMRLTLGSEGRFLSASLKCSSAAEVAGLEPGARVRATGVVAVAYRGSVPSGSAERPVNIELLLRTPADLALLQPAPWWTPQRVNWALGIGVALGAAAGLWILALRRAVRRQTARLNEALRTHRNSELEFEASQRERLRLASDLHDNFQQLLAGSIYRLNAAAKCLPDLPAEAAEQITHAQRTLAHTQSEFRDALTGLTDVAEGPPDFIALLRHAARQMDHWPEDGVKIRGTGASRPLSQHLMGSLLMLFREAVGNAFHHGGATQAEVTVDFGTEALTLTVADDGRGFDPASAPVQSEGHFGLSSMRERMRWLGGTLAIHSQPGAGARIVAQISWASAAALEVSPARGMEAAAAS